MPVKKTTTTKKTPAKKTTSKPVTKKTSTKKSPTKKDHIKREVIGILYITLSVITVFSILDFEGFLLGGYKTTVSFFIGFGIYVLPVSLLALGILCFTNFKGNVSLRSIAILTFPILSSCFAHILIYSDKYRLNLDDLKIVIEKGMEQTSAGILGGFLSIILEASLSTVGAVIILFILNTISLFICFNLTPKGVYKTIVEYFDNLGYEEDEEETEYKLSQKEMKKAQKEKQKEHVVQLKDAKKQAYNKYKDDVEVRTPKKYQNFNIDVDIEDRPILNQEEEVERPKADKWIIDEYNKIKERQENTQKIDYVMEDLSEIELLEQKISDFENGIHNTNQVKYEEIEKEVSNEVKKIVLNEVQKDISNEVQKIAPKIEEVKYIEPIKPIEPEIFIAKSFVSDNEISDIKKDIAEAIEQTISDNTSQYVHAKKEIIPDEIKSTMTYQTVSNFNKEDLKYKYSYPSIRLLTPKLKGSDVDPTEELRDSSERLIETLDSFGVTAQIINIVRGPSITRFEITISRGVKFSKITSLSDDIALSLGASNVRIAPIPDKIAIGIEVPNKTTDMVLIREVLDSNEFRNTKSKLSYALGKDITGQPAIGDIAKMPHMLIAGTTGSGKSVCVNSMLVSLLYKADPTEVKFIMIDPKMVELGGYNGIPHLLIPVVTDPKKAAGALNWAVGEMMKRYKLFAECNVKDLVSYNINMEGKIKNGDTEAKKLPQVVIVIDELADLMMIAAKEVEESICRIAQMARAAGMHLVIATQRPSSDVITGIMKANIPSRISFAVSSQIESRIILDTSGAEKLIGKGDMLYNPLGAPKPQRLQGCFISSSEVEAVVEYVKTIAEPDYNEEVLNHIESHSVKDGGGVSSSSDDSDEDPVIEDAIDIIVSTGQASTSFLQRKLKLGYARASRVIDQIEDRGIIGPSDGAKARQVLITRSEWQEMKIRKMN